MREYVLVFLVAAAVTYLLTVVAREIALRTGAVARVRDRDVHAEPVPYLGGLAMLGGLLAAYLVARELPFLSTRSGPFVFRDAGIVLIAGAFICAIGILDDLFELDALTKLGGQILAAGFLVFQNVQYIYFEQQRHAVHHRPGARCAADGLHRRRDDERGELRRRPRWPCRRRGVHRGARLLRVLLPDHPVQRPVRWRRPERC